MRYPFVRRAGRVEKGQALPIFVFGLVAILGIAALGVDAGFWRYQQRLAQSAADSGAMAGAIELQYSTAPANVTSAAQKDSATNGFANGVANVAVTVNNPPASGPYTANGNAVEVIVTKQAPSFLAGMLGIHSQLIGARAVALSSTGNRNCFYALQPSGQSLFISGANVITPTCGFTVNGNSVISGSNVTVSSITYVGTSSISGSTVNVTPIQISPISDPCTTVSGCQSLTTTPPTNGTCMSTTTYTGVNVTIQPGTYCSTLTITSSNITFAAGLYILENGLNVSGSNVTGTNVTVYNEAGAISMSGANNTLTAPTTGTTAGVLFYQKKSDTQTFTLSGSNGGTGLNGMLYFPGAPVTISGGMGQWPFVVGYTVTISGSGVVLTSSYFPGIARVALAE